jgi:hypothetical protein
MDEKKEWFWYEDNSGWPVYHLKEYRGDPSDAAKEIKIGDEVAVRSLTGYVRATVTEHLQKGEYLAESNDCLYPISFNKEKAYWVCSFSMHKKGLKQCVNKK